MNDIIDEIDALVDEQMAEGESAAGYFWVDGTYPACAHCKRNWHGLKITARMEEMAAQVAYDEDYRYSEDDSEVICPGSNFIGPWATPRQLEQMRAGTAHITIKPHTMGFAERMYALVRAGYTFPQRIILGFDGADRSQFEAARDRIRDARDIPFGVHIAEWASPEPPPQWQIEVGNWTLPDYTPPPEPEPDTRTPQERALPRPSTTPPMWAQDPNRTRRARTNTRRRHR